MLFMWTKWIFLSLQVLSRIEICSLGGIRNVLILDVFHTVDFKRLGRAADRRLI